MAKIKMGNIMGPKGDKGDRGSLWRVTDKMTGQSTGDTAFPGANIEDSAVGDMCLNPITCDIYKCTAGGDAANAKWVWVMNNRGPQGPAGPKGDPTTVDAVLSESSANPIQNKAVATKFQDVQDSLSLRVPYVTGVKDLDAITNTFCFFMTNASPAGCPTKSGEWFVGLQFRLNDRWMTQALFPIGSTSIYMRAINNGNKYNWIKLGAH